MVSRSEDWLSKIERGERDLRKLDMIVRLAGVLRVSVADVLGQPVLMEDEQDPRGEDVPAVRDALMTPRRLPSPLRSAVWPGDKSAARCRLRRAGVERLPAGSSRQGHRCLARIA